MDERAVTREDLQTLPLRAIVAYAARCAGRVVPLFPRVARYFWRRKKDLTAIRAAVSVAEFFAEDALVGEFELRNFLRSSGPPPGPGGARDVAMDLATVRAAAAGDQAEAVAKEMMSRKNLPAAAIASAASAAAFTAVKAAYSRNNPAVTPDDVVAQALISDLNASLAAVAGGAGAEERAAKIADYEQLATLPYIGRWPDLGEPIRIPWSLWPTHEPPWASGRRLDSK
jgi:hypothetical protein